MTIEIPEELESLRDAAVAYAYGASQEQPNLKPLEDWFEQEDGWDTVVMSVEGMAIYLKNIADCYFSDEELRAEIDITPRKRVTNAQRLAYARDRLDYALREAEDTLHAVKISQDPPAYLACIVESKGQGGWEVNWLGVYKTVEELTSVDDNPLGFFIAQEHISDAKILSLWSKK